MKVIAKNARDSRKQLLVKADWEEVRLDYIDILTAYKKFAVPGFRPGKAPEYLVESHYKKNIRDDLKAQCVERLTRKALKDQQLMAGSRIEISDLDVEPLKPLQFSVHFTPLPDFDLPDYSRLQLNGESDEERRDTISEWLLTHTELTVPEDIVREELEFDGDRDAELHSDQWKVASRRVSLMVTLQKIAEQDGIEVDDRDLSDRIDRMAGESGMSPSDLRQRLLQNGGLMRIRNFLLAEMTLDYLLELGEKGEN